MRQIRAIDCVVNQILEDGLAEAIFLKGSIAKGIADEVSDVDLYIVVSENNRESFLEKRLGYLEQYGKILYYSYENFVGPQIVAIYEDGLHFDLYVVDKDAIPSTGVIKIVYDPSKLLSDYKASSLSVSPVQLVGVLNTFSYTLIEMRAAIYRKDDLWLNRLFHLQFSSLTLLLRHCTEPENALLGSKRLISFLTAPLHEELVDLLIVFPENNPLGLTKLFILYETVLDLLDPEIVKQSNVQFYQFGKKYVLDCVSYNIV